MHSRTHTLVTQYEEEEDNRLVDNFYQPPPLRRERREHREPRIIRLDLFHFYGNKDVEDYLDW